jgi:hypothetical protein
MTNQLCFQTEERMTEMKKQLNKGTGHLIP